MAMMKLHRFDPMSLRDWEDTRSQDACYTIRLGRLQPNPKHEVAATMEVA